MSLILNLDTATSICSVALARDGKVIAERSDGEGRNHAALLTKFIGEVLAEAGLEPEALNAVAVSKGPGSYTGLRIGVSTAKGIAYGLSIPLVSAGTLEIMANGYLNKNPLLKNQKDLLLCPMIDARRMEVYAAFYRSDLSVFRTVGADIVDENTYRNFLDNHPVIFFGDGAGKCQETLHHENASFDSKYRISASHMAGITLEKFNIQDFEDTAYFEPFYLKDFIATIPKNKII